VRALSDTDAAWLAGLYEGEGCLSRRKPGTWQVTISMTDVDVVERAHDLTAIGNVRTRPPANARCQPQAAWVVTRRDDIATLMLALRPWLGVRRRERCDEMLREHAELGLGYRRTASPCEHGVALCTSCRAQERRTLAAVRSLFAA
jgi:hypothetical protein